MFLLGVFMYFGKVKLFGAAILAAVLHELGHIVYLIWKQRKIHEICFDICGAVIRSEPLCTSDDALCALTGPLANLIFSAACFRCFPMFAQSGFVLGVYNMLPIYPLDGGRALAALLPMRVVRYISGGVCVLLLIAAFSVCIYFELSLWFGMMIGAILIRIWRLGRNEAL